jgi:hypothetical protein
MELLTAPRATVLFSRNGKSRDQIGVGHVHDGKS